MALTIGKMLPLQTRRPALLTALTQHQLQPVRWNTTKSNTNTKGIRIQARTPEQGREILARQRLHRPVAPHLSIYKWQVNSISSALERNTGILFSGPLYLLATSYLFAPYVGWDLSSTSMIAAFAGLPLAAKLMLKFAVAWPFTFHVINGVRYVLTAVGTQTLRNKEQFVRIAWGVAGASFVSAVGLVAYF
ncbi:hypothetical protein FE257_009166 [Aspergillus nanangensis]|uniref:Uncharacterized protein n=1 Tax=Aspergillus nanangensis TaxID=2582783 RepID=A0AAD4CKE6_ASPNN|nr:hypothetical protein FE257_009166 [Aspergillus nanangensis]